MADGILRMNLAGMDPVLRQRIKYTAEMIIRAFDGSPEKAAEFAEARRVWAIIAELETPAPLTPSADLPACRDEGPAHAHALAACYPDPPEYQHPDGDPR